MKMNLIDENPFPESAELEEIRAENEILAQQVKRLIRAEGKLYAYQEQLDSQLREYKDLYELNRKLNASFELRDIFTCSIEYIIHNLEYERVLLLEETGTSGEYAVTALDGYYEEDEREKAESLVIRNDDPFLTPLYRGVEYIICNEGSDTADLVEYRDRFLMNEYLVYPLCVHGLHMALLVVGNTRRNAGFCRMVSDADGALLGMGNLAGLLSSCMENHISHISMIKALEHERVAESERKNAEMALQRLNNELEQRVADRTGELEAANSELLQVTRELENACAGLKAAQSRVLQQEKMASIGQLAAGVAHEINNPMGFIISNLNSLKKYTDKVSAYMDAQSAALDGLIAATAARVVGDDLAALKKALKIDYVMGDLGSLIDESLEGAERVKKIVQELKSFSRIDESEVKAADINGGLESTINIVWNELKYKATVIREYGEIPRTACNPGQLNQVFMNILVNAAQAIDTKGEIAIRTWSDNGFIGIAISDTGKGIAPDKLGRIFEPFFTTKEVGKGTGLGLSIAYDIVKKHDGEIRVESEEGKGTTFTILLPVRG